MVMAAFFPTAMMTDNILYPPFRGTVTWCAGSICISLTAAQASIYSTAAIGLERAIIVFFPFQSSRYGKREKCTVIALIWILSAAPIMLTVSSSELLTHPNGHIYCEIGYIINQPYFQWLVTMQYFVPTFITVISYTLIIVKLCMRKNDDTVSNHLSNTHGKAISRLQIMLVVDAFLTLVAWLPQNLYFTIFTNYEAGFSEFTTQTFVLDACFAALISTNTFSTPIVYFIFNKYFRMDAKMLLQSVRCTKPPPTQSTIPSSGSKGVNINV
ncbi:putative neuropeptide Y receptor 11 [Watersipora subatra]|uniref:putative neuropeptide Y receptor 11 n=1 Tax=Watersipora subatra TaxID=2589382 RepID=UPI00355C9A71